MADKVLEKAQSKILSNFITLGDKIEQLDNYAKEQLVLQAINENPWFTKEHVSQSLDALSNYLNEEKLTHWANRYPPNAHPKKVGIIMASNIPLVGFHDLLAVLVSNNIAIVKLSSSDSVLMKWVIQSLIEIDLEMNNRIFIADKLNDIDAVIATGSNNTARYFDYYFSKYPHIIRRNRNSVAVLDGSENKETLQKLAQDIFSYYGLGCRNVSKIYIPVGYNFDLFFQGIENYRDIILKHKYANNYDYHKSIFLVNQEVHLDNGFILLKESKNISSSIAVLNYDYYTKLDTLREELSLREKEIQCIVGNKKNIPEAVNFGNSQYPELKDYADKVDTMLFLTSL